MAIPRMVRIAPVTSPTTFAETLFANRADTMEPAVAVTIQISRTSHRSKMIAGSMAAWLTKAMMAVIVADQKTDADPYTQKQGKPPNTTFPTEKAAKLPATYMAITHVSTIPPVRYPPLPPRQR